jgi:hypothetical protein
VQRVLALFVLVGLALQAACSASSSVAPTPVPAAVLTVPPAVAASVGTVSSPSPATPTALPPSPTAVALRTPTAVAAKITVWVGDTDGGGVFLRNSPHDGDRADVLLDGTPLTITGDEVEGDGQRWYPVKTSDGFDGYVQVIYTTTVEPSGPPAPPQAPPK